MLGIGKESKFKKAFGQKLEKFGFRDAGLRGYILPEAFNRAKQNAAAYKDVDIWSGSASIPPNIALVLKDRKQEEAVRAFGTQYGEYACYWQAPPIVQQMWWCVNELIVLTLTLKITDTKGKDNLVNELKRARVIYAHPFDTSPLWTGQDARIPLELMPRILLWLSKNGIDPFDIDQKQPSGNAASVNAHVRAQIAAGTIAAPSRDELSFFYGLD